jgi:hypothetical protein
MFGMSKYLVESTLKRLISEAPGRETDNAPIDAADSPFTPAEERFLGKFDAYGSKHLGIIYSVSDIGIREFITRSGADLNVTPGILLNLLKNKVIKIVPYTGFGRNTDYTLELQLSLDDVAGLGAEDKEKIEAGDTSGGGGGGAAAGMPEIPEAPAAPEVAWVVKYGDILRESVKITKNLLSEGKKSKMDIQIPEKDTRVLNNLPKEYINHLSKVIKAMDKHTKTTLQREKMIADIIDILQINFKLTPNQIQKSYELHKSQKRLQKYLNDK